MYRPSLLLCAALLAFAHGCRNQGGGDAPPLTEDELAQLNDPLRLSCWPQAGSWPQFARDPLHTGRSDVDLGSADLELAWKFQPSTHVWNYEPGFCVWSSPVAGMIEGRHLVIAGHYDRNVYAIDAATGNRAWAFTPGAPVFATPALGRVAGRAMVFVASLNRSIYGLDAATGEQLWQFETAPWSFTQASSFMSSPTLVRDGASAVLVIGAWNSDRSARRNVQSGEVIALNADDGSLRWRRRLASVPITSPAVARLAGELTVFAACHHGGVYALRLADGTSRWESVLNEETRSSPCLAAAGGLPLLLIGTRLNTLFALDAQTGARRWRRDAGYWIDSTPAWFVAPGGTAPGKGATVVAGSYDRRFYAWSLDGQSPQWEATTGNHAYSSVAVASLGSTPVVLAMSWDGHCYLFDGTSGRTLWRAGCGPLLWSHAYMGDSLWASPVVADVEGTPTVLVAAYDGVLYAYQPRPGARSRPPSRPA